jgi:cell division protein FtsB
MLFFDRNDFISAIKMKLELSRLEEQQEYYKQELQNTKQIQKAIFEHNENLEKFAREKFYMKKDDELLYVIVEE